MTPDAAPPKNARQKEGAVGRLPFLYYDAQEDSDFGKPADRLSAIRKAPFYGFWMGACVL